MDRAAGRSWSWYWYTTASAIAPETELKPGPPASLIHAWTPCAGPPSIFSYHIPEVHCVIVDNINNNDLWLQNKAEVTPSIKGLTLHDAPFCSHT